MAESSEGKHILRTVDQVGVARNERKDHLSKSEHPKGAMGRGTVACSVASAYSLRTHKGATHSMSVKRAPQWGDGVVTWCRKQSTYREKPLQAHKGAIHSMSAKASIPTGRWSGHGGAFGGVLRNARK